MLGRRRHESNVYVGGIGTTLASHFKFTGQATISPGWYAGYVIHVEADRQRQPADDQSGHARRPRPVRSSRGTFDGISTLQSFWFIKSDHLGKLGVGLQSQASDNTAILVDGSGSLVPANWVPFDYGGFYLASGRSATHWRRTLVLPSAASASAATATACRRTSCATTCRPSAASRCRPLGVKTTSGTLPLVMRVSGTASRFAAAAAYSVSSTWSGRDSARMLSDLGLNGLPQAVAVLLRKLSSTTRSSSRSALISSTSRRACSSTAPTAISSDYLSPGINAADDHDFWYVKAGLRERWTPLGHTVLYGEYKDSERWRCRR